MATVKVKILSDTRQATQGVGKVSKSLGLLNKAAKATALGGVALVGTSLVKGFSRLNNIDIAKTKMKALGYDAKATQSLMDSALLSVKGTSHGLDAAATTAASAAAAGVKAGKEMDSYLKMVANGASLSGRSMQEFGAITNKVNTNTVASMGEINQIADAGLPILQNLADHYGVNAQEMKKMVSAGKVDAKTFNKVLGESVEGAAKTMGTTLPAIFANITASLGRMGAYVLSGPFSAIKGGATGILNAFEGIEPVAERLGKSLGSGMKDAVQRFKDFRTNATQAGTPLNSLATSAKKVGSALKSSIGPVINGLKGFGTFLAPIAAFLAKVAAAAVFVALKGVLEGLAPVITTVATAFEAMGVWLADNRKTIGTVAAIIGAALLPVLTAVTITLGVQAVNAGITAAAWLAYGVAVKTISIATKAWAAVQWVLNAAMMANPIGAVIIVVLGLVAAFVVAYKKVDWFRNGVNKAWSVIKTGTIALGNAIKTVFTKINSVITTAASWIKQKMTEAKAGTLILVNGVISMHRSIVQKVAAVIAFFVALPGKIKGALSGAGSWLVGIGQNIIQGLVNGLESGRQWVVSKIKAIADLVPGWLKKKLGIASPSKVTAKLGRWITKGLVKGLVKGFPETIKAVQNLAKIINTKLPKELANAKPPKSLKSDKAISKWYKDRRKKIKKWNAEHAKEIAAGTKATLKAVRADAVAHLNALKKQRNDYAAAVTEAAKAYANIGNIQLGENESLSRGSIKNFLADRLSAIQTFTKKLATLAKNGLSKDLYDQIVQMGPEQGLAYAEALATSTPAQLKELNNIQNQINKATGALGSSTSKTMYQAGIDSAQGYVNGLNKLLKKVAAMGTKISKSLVKSLKKALGIKSPSKVTGALGRWTGLGFTKQLDRTIPDIEKVAGRMKTAIIDGYERPTLKTKLETTGSAGKAVENHYHFEIKTDATTDRVALGKEIKKVIREAELAGAR